MKTRTHSSRLLFSLFTLAALALLLSPTTSQAQSVCADLFAEAANEILLSPDHLAIIDEMVWIGNNLGVGDTQKEKNETSAAMAVAMNTALDRVVEAALIMRSKNPAITPEVKVMEQNGFEVLVHLLQTITGASDEMFKEVLNLRIQAEAARSIKKNPIGFLRSEEPVGVRAPREKLRIGFGPTEKAFELPYGRAKIAETDKATPDAIASKTPKGKQRFAIGFIPESQSKAASSANAQSDDVKTHRPIGFAPMNRSPIDDNFEYGIALNFKIGAFTLERIPLATQPK